MELNRTNQTGFSAIELVIVIVVVAALGSVGYFVYDRQQVKTANNNTSQEANEGSASADDVEAAPDINSTGDLDKAQAVLDQTDPEASNKNDVSQLDNELAAF